MSTLEQAEAWGEAQAMERIATLTAEVARYREALDELLGQNGKTADTLDLIAGGRAPSTDAIRLLAEAHRWAGTKARALLSQPFDLAAHQRAMAREYVTEERLRQALERPIVGDFIWRYRGAGLTREQRGRALAAAILAVLFEEET